MANNGIHEIPTKDTDGNVAHASTGESLVLFTLMYHRGKNATLANNFRNFKDSIRFLS